MNYFTTKQDLQGNRLYGVGGLKMIQENWIKTSSKPNNSTVDKIKSQNKRR